MDSAIANRFATPQECARFERFLDWLARRGRAESTVRSYRSDWTALTMWFRRHAGARFAADALDAETLEAWRAASLGRGSSPSTVLRRTAFARTYITWLGREGVLDAEVAEAVRDEVRLHRAERGPRVLTPPEVHRLLEQVDARGCLRDQALVYVLLDSGIRVSELVGLDVGDVDFARGALSVGGGKPRAVPLPTRTARKLAWSLGERGLLALPDHGEIVLPASGGWPPAERVEPPDPASLPALRAVPLSPMPFGCNGPPARWPLFVGERGRLSANGVQRALRKHARFARVEATPQVLRQTFGIAFWARHHDLVALAEVLGLESVETARPYTQVEVAEVEDARLRAFA